jgi:hypothetical protein
MPAHRRTSERKPCRKQLLAALARMQCNLLSLEFCDELLDPVHRDRVDDLRGYFSVVPDLLVELQTSLTHRSTARIQPPRKNFVLQVRRLNCGNVQKLTIRGGVTDRSVANTKRMPNGPGSMPLRSLAIRCGLVSLHLRPARAHQIFKMMDVSGYRFSFIWTTSFDGLWTH